MRTLHAQVRNNTEAAGKQPSERRTLSLKELKDVRTSFFRVSISHIAMQMYRARLTVRKRGRVLCWVLTYPLNSGDMQAKAIAQTWGSQCVRDHACSVHPHVCADATRSCSARRGSRPWPATPTRACLPLDLGAGSTPQRGPASCLVVLH